MLGEIIGEGGRQAAANGPRVLMYSHDTMGLGHLRRCRTIAHALVEADESVSVLILSGSPMFVEGVLTLTGSGRPDLDN